MRNIYEIIFNIIGPVVHEMCKDFTSFSSGRVETFVLM